MSTDHTYAMVQDFHDDEQVFRVGTKPLNSKSVEAAHGNRDRVVPIAAAHLTREIKSELCRSGGRIDPSRSALNYSLLEDVPMQVAAIKARAIALMEQHGIKWQSLRKDKIMAAETIISLPPGFAGDVDAFLADSLYFTENIAFGHRVPVIAAVVHVDEREGVPHLHVLTLPITPDGRMDGHDLVGYTGMHQKRNDLFHEHVGKRYGLERPMRKVSMRHADRAYLTDQLMAKFAADCPAWASKPAVMKSLRKMVLADPLGMAKAHGFALPHDDQADHQEAGTAYMRLPDDDAGLPVPEINRMPVSAVACGTLPDADAGADGHQDADIDLAGDDGECDPVAMVLAGPALQTVMPEPIRIVVSAADPGLATGADEPPERLVRVRDADMPADRWDAVQGEHVPLPPPKQSMRRQVLLGVHAALGTHIRDRNARAPQVAALLDPLRPRTGRDADRAERQLDVLPEQMLHAA
jgi:hypothetical protein